MSDIGVYWKIASIVKGMAIIGVTGYLFYYLVKPFLIKDKDAAVTGAVYAIVMLVLYFIPYEMDSMAAHAFGMAVTFAVMYLVDRNHIEQKLFLVITMFLLEWVSYDLALIPDDILTELFLCPPAVQKSEILSVMIYAVLKFIFVIILFIILAFLIYIIHKVYIYKKEDMTLKELILVISTPLSVLLGYCAFTFFSNTYLKDTNQYIWVVHGEYMWVRALYQTASFIAMIINIDIYQSIRKSHREEKENAVLLEQVENMERHIHDVEELYSDIRGLKHDMANHVMILENLFEKNAREEAVEYFNQLKERLAETETEMKSGNPVTDVILTEKKKEAGKKGIAFTCDFHYPEKTKINAFDVSVILNNAVNNAMEGACKCKTPYIKIKSYRKANAYMIEVRNNFTGEIIMDEESGVPKTTKDIEGQHGYGLTNIRKVAQKYFGDIDIAQSEFEFVLSVMLMAE